VVAAAAVVVVAAEVVLVEEAQEEVEDQAPVVKVRRINVYDCIFLNF